MSISTQDLLEFHKKHLGEFQGTIKFDEAGQDEDTEPSLGFYPDGVERTLTDEQIEFFRQSDIRKEELRIYKENLVLQGAESQAEAHAEAQAKAETNIQALDPTSQQRQIEVANDEEGMNEGPGNSTMS
ncbi:hypothetical protein B0I72DRAFT_6620 [Yarrowia lipolytica]|jgi:hypothetical protein|uniref:YALI0F31295p n=2 Tax=Yarrowia lipolytica TaxID=4952 RepID=Q6BZS3_YARLI|nr:YALI0F31295p [Yarrowia lipolytica CLIB122]AOW07951.1 hypothetical protein YALI1_F38998g [Yarrowia lipolytica]KAB8282339.1 hypothetical protein BKA91DRAFT_24767 [Yarrowia lipolytica]KAE8172275.1 hypothetical protein BKA90DRAFT_137545 [Yarrowia lipolytica]KAJ8055016.1 hypothetical protein LXG23DRAFT_47084 [Yarrowia lipolytica]QNP99574.1 Hypothetical protein YALI2_E00890g [Yarrowia lipolytica]|eukprot:XP_506089.1 YALI0F31295p [Yarrowia lipolytica CLIB122]